MNKTYIQTVTTIKARCRNKRLREAGAGGGSNSVVKSIIEANSGSATNHTHDNKSDLDKLSVSDGYLNITDYETQEDGSEIKKTNKVKAGVADEATNATSWAGHLFDAFWQSITDMFSALSDKFISKEKDDSTPFSLGVGKNLTVGGNSSVTGDSSIGGDNTVKGNQIITGSVFSENFNTDDQTGFIIEQKESDNKRYRMLITDLEIWGKATFNTLEVRKLVSVGGNYMFSPASGKILTVQYFDTFYRCYFLADDGTMAITNDFRVDDNVFCDTSNIKAGVYANVSNKRYWRTVVAVSEVSEILYDKGLVYWGQVDDDHIVYDADGNPVTFISGNTLYKGKKFYWIDLSKTSCEAGSDIPASGDDVATFGNLTDVQRQDVTYIISFGDDAPALKMYAGVNSFDITGKRPVIISPKMVEIYAKIFKLIATDGSTIDIEKTFAEIKLTQDSISAKVNSNGFINFFDPAVYGKVIKGNPYTFWIDQDSEFAAVCATFTGLTVGNKYTVKIPVKNVDCIEGATFDAYISATAPTLTYYQENNDYSLLDFSAQGDIYIKFTAISTTMYAGVITGSSGWTNNTGGYAHVEIQNISLFSEDLLNALLATGLDIESHKINATADSFLIRDNNGNVNTVFETDSNGNPVLKAKYIQADKIVATKIKTSESGVRTEVINDMISQYNDVGELAVRIHGGTLNSSTGTSNVSSISPGILNKTLNATDGLIQEFDVALSDPFEVLSLMNTIKVLDSSGNTNVPVDCAITCNNVKSIGYELYVSDVAGDNMVEAYIWAENPETGTLNLTKGMSGTVVMSSLIARTGCKIYVHFVVEFNNSTGSLVIRNTNLEDNIESIFNVSIKYGGNVTEIAKDGFLTSFGNYGFKISASGIQKTLDGGETWSSI